MKKTILAAMPAALALALVSPDAHATDLLLESGLSGHATEWRGDGGGYGSLKLGVRFWDIVGLHLQGRAGYGVVDDRVLTLISLGAQVWGDIAGVRPYGRVGFLHQHEESRSVIAGDYGSALLGIGEGIRHRAGVEGGLGVDIPFAATDTGFLFFANVDGSAKVFPDQLGPKVYAGGGLGLGFSYTL